MPDLTEKGIPLPLQTIAFMRTGPSELPSMYVAHQTYGTTGYNDLFFKLDRYLEFKGTAITGPGSTVDLINDYGLITPEMQDGYIAREAIRELAQAGILVDPQRGIPRDALYFLTNLDQLLLTPPLNVYPNREYRYFIYTDRRCYGVMARLSSNDPADAYRERAVFLNEHPSGKIQSLTIFATSIPNFRGRQRVASPDPAEVGLQYRIRH